MAATLCQPALLLAQCITGGEETDDERALVFLRQVREASREFFEDGATQQLALRSSVSHAKHMKRLLAEMGICMPRKRVQELMARAWSLSPLCGAA